LVEREVRDPDTGTGALRHGQRGALRVVAAVAADAGSGAA
jgi:hypothetical protein